MSIFDRMAQRAMGLNTRAISALPSNRAPRGAMGTVNNWNYSSETQEERYSSEEVIAKAYERNVWAYRCVDAISNSISSLPFRAGDPVSNNYKLSPPLARLLGPEPGSPNPMWSSSMLMKYSVASYVLMGKFAWAIERDSARNIVGLWPLRAQHIHPIPAKSGTEYFKRFEYNTRGSDGYTEYSPDDIVYIWRPALWDFLQPESPVNVSRLKINKTQLLDQFEYNFLKNGGVPAHMIVTPPFATAADRAGFQQQFLSDFSGPANAGKVMFAEREIEGEGEGGTETIDVKVLGTSQKDAELRATYNGDKTAICIAFGVPLSILGDSTAVTFSNAFQDRRNYWLEGLLPKAREIQGGINTHLAPMLGKEVGWFDTSGVPELMPEPAIPYQVALEYVQQKIITKDELRADMGLPPAEDVGLSPDMEEPEPVPAALAPTPSDSLEKEAGADVVPPASAPQATAPAASRAVTAGPSSSAITSHLKSLHGELSHFVVEKASSRRGLSKEDFDINFWAGRYRTALVPSLREMGMTETKAEVVAEHLFRQTHAEFTKEQSVEFFENRIVTDLAIIMKACDVRQVPVAEVEKALLAIHSGTVNVDDALSALGADVV